VAAVVARAVSSETQFIHTPNRSAFHLDLNVREGHEGYHTLSKCPAPIGMKSLAHQVSVWKSVGGTKPTLTVTQQTVVAAKRQKLAMSIAMKPAQQIAMQAFMLYMSGSQLNMFSINVTTMAIISPLSAILALDQTFSKLQDTNLQIPKLIYLALNLLFLGIGLYKMSSMRLLPTTAADWTSKIAWKAMAETTSIPPEPMVLFLNSGSP
jgi:ER membrane protein complex subunit 4